MGFCLSLHWEGSREDRERFKFSIASVGHKRKVVTIQFSKWWKNLGNIRFRKCLNPTMRFTRLVVKDGMD